jgi:hypothetical protein
MMRVVAISLLCVACSSPVGRGPLHICEVSIQEVGRWENLGDACPCQPPPTATWVSTGYRYFSGIFAPPGSLPRNTLVVARYDHLTIEGYTSGDGSLEMTLDSDFDSRGQTVDVQVGTEHFEIVLDRFSEAWPFAPGDDPRFPEGEIAIEEPVGTIAVHARFEPTSTRASPITSVVVRSINGFAWPGTSQWLDPTPALNQTFDATIPGEEGNPIGVTALHESGTASACGLDWERRCTCSSTRRVLGLCRDQATPPTQLRTDPRPLRVPEMPLDRDTPQQPPDPPGPF